jgi:hypothetical protein
MYGARSYKFNGEPVCTRLVAYITPSMFAGHSMLCPYESSGKSESSFRAECPALFLLREAPGHAAEESLLDVRFGDW